MRRSVPARGRAVDRPIASSRSSRPSGSSQAGETEQRQRQRGTAGLGGAPLPQMHHGSGEGERHEEADLHAGERGPDHGVGEQEEERHSRRERGRKIELARQRPGRRRAGGVERRAEDLHPQQQRAGESEEQRQHRRPQRRRRSRHQAAGAKREAIARARLRANWRWMKLSSSGRPRSSPISRRPGRSPRQAAPTNVNPGTTRLRALFTAGSRAFRATVRGSLGRQGSTAAGATIHPL